MEAQQFESFHLSNLAVRLVNSPPREIAGADASLRFHYQAVYGLTLIFHEHKSANDYALLFEFHDDLALLNKSIDPTTVSFFQVKTKEKGVWSLADIAKQKTTTNEDGTKKQHPSHIAKIYHNAILFGEFVDSITFVSNAQMAFGMKSPSFELDECSVEEIDKVVAQIKKEHPGVKSVNTKILRFAASNLSLGDLDTHAKGKLHDFVVEHIGDVEYSLEALYRAVVADCSRKSRDKQIDKTLADVVTRRGVTRKDTEAWLDTVRQRIAVPNWDSFAADLKIPIVTKIKIRQEWNRYCIEVMNCNAAVRAVRGEISKALDLESSSSLTSLQEVVDHVLAIIETFAIERLNPVSAEKLKAMIIYETFARTEN